MKGYAPDPARARRLLAEAGYPDGLEITLDAPAGRYQGDKEIAEALGGQWQKAGFRPKVQVAEWGAYFKKYLGKQIQDAYLLGLGGPMQDGDELYNLVSSKGRGLYYKNEKVDELFDQGRSTTDPAKRRKIYADLARLMVEDATWVFLMQQVDIYATRDRSPGRRAPISGCSSTRRRSSRQPNRRSAPSASKEGDSLLVREMSCGLEEPTGLSTRRPRKLCIGDTPPAASFFKCLCNHLAEHRAVVDPICTTLTGTFSLVPHGCSRYGNH